MSPLPELNLSFSGIASALPEKVITNHDLSAVMDTSDEWIVERTGIRERRVGGTTSGLAIQAGQLALERAGVDPSSIDHLVLATTSPDKRMPSTAVIVAKELGLTCGAFDLQAVCAGWVYGLIVSTGFLAQGMDRILLIGAETMDRLIDHEDRSTAILFGNGAGATLLERKVGSNGNLLAWDLGAEGGLSHILYTDFDDYLKMDGREVFRKAVSVIVDSCEKTMEKAQVGVEDIQLVVPHQANVRIFDAAWKKLGFSMDQTAVVLDYTGNTSAASIPIALDDSVQKGKVKTGDTVLFVGFGAGMAWGSALVEIDLGE